MGITPSRVNMTMRSDLQLNKNQYLLLYHNELGLHIFEAQRHALITKYLGNIAQVLRKCCQKVNVTSRLVTQLKGNVDLPKIS